jgi:hypothetical protein
VELSALSPLGSLRPLAIDGGRTAEPLGTPSHERLQELASRFDLVLVCGDDCLVTPHRAAELWGEGVPAAAATLLVDGLGAALESECRVEWAGVGLDATPEGDLAERIRAASSRRQPITVVDSGSAAHLTGAGVTAPIRVSAPCALLLPMILGEEVLLARRDFLRAMGWAWPQGGVVTVAGDRSLLGLAAPLGRALVPLVTDGVVAVQLAVSGGLRGEEDFAGALGAALGGRFRRLPGVSAPDDLAATVAGSAAYVGPAGLGLWLAGALGVPCATPVAVDRQGDLADELGAVRFAPTEAAATLRRLLAPDAPRPSPRAAIARVEQHLDACAERALHAAWRRAGTAGRATDGWVATSRRLAALRRALDGRGRQLVEDRRAFTTRLDRVVAEHHAEVERLRDELERLRAELVAARRDNDLMVGSRTWRYTQPVRDTLSRVRELRR